MPYKCDNVILGGFDIIKDTESIADKTCGLSVCTFLPVIPELKKKIFHTDNNTFKTISKEVFIENTLKQLLPSKSGEFQCIIMFSNEKGYSLTKSFSKKLQQK